MPANDEAIDFKRRARRRLIGAIALVLFLVIVPPWVMEREPRTTQSTLSVEIPSQDAKKLVPKAPATAPRTESPKPAPEMPAQPAEKPAAPAPEAKPAAEPRSAGVVDPAAKALKDPGPKKPAEKPADKPAERAGESVADAERAGAALAGGYSVTIGTFANPENVKQLEAKLAAAGLKSYTEPVTISGAQQTRIRAGPFPTREAAERARERLTGMGLKPGPVAPRQ
ncbi:MAG: SPOR domain-containing protein [Burkholderiales bacterium]|nr:SPOR domain-containing protein [Burkholderiales bacterium]